MIDQAILLAALEGPEHQRAKLEEHSDTVRALLTGRKKPGPKPKSVAETEDGDAAPGKKRRKKRNLSPEARERIAAAQKKRWAAARKVDG
jgi:hypothetical protein